MRLSRGHGVVVQWRQKNTGFRTRSPSDPSLPFILLPQAFQLSEDDLTRGEEGDYDGPGAGWSTGLFSSLCTMTDG